MKISCIIPTKDRCDMVLRAIDSALSQQADLFEIVLVDDGSVDGTSEVVQERYPDVKIVRLSGLGQGLARNAGVKASQGDVLMFLEEERIRPCSKSTIRSVTLPLMFNIQWCIS